MNPIIIKAVPCSVCGAKRGDPCSRNGEGGCGMRLDDFIRDAPYKDRLKLHLEDMEYFRNEPWYDDSMEEELASFLLTTEEYRQLKGDHNND